VDWRLKKLGERDPRSLQLLRGVTAHQTLLDCGTQRLCPTHFHMLHVTVLAIAQGVKEASPSDSLALKLFHVHWLWPRAFHFNSSINIQEIDRVVNKCKH
jgi:hypothetical protein